MEMEMEMEINQQINLPSSSSQSADDDVITGFISLKPEGSVNQSADDDVSFGDDDNNQHLKPDGSVNPLADDDVISGFNRLKPEDTVNQSADDDVSSGFKNVNPEGSVNQSADADDVISGDSVGQSAAADDVSFHNDSVDQSANGDVSVGFNHLQIDSNSPEIDVEDEEEEDDDDDVDGDFTFACVGDDTDSFNGYETGEIRTVYPLFDQSLLSGDDYNDGKLKLPINVPVNKIYIESPSNNETVQALSDETGSMKMKSNSTGFSKLWRFRKEMNRSNSDSRDAFVFFEKSTEKVNVTGRSTEKVNVTGGKGKAVRKELNSKKVVASAHEVYLKQKAGQPEEERRRSYLPYRPGLMGFFTNVNGGLSKNVHPF